MTEYKPIKSSNLEAANYNAGTKVLLVKFRNGTEYCYPNVSATLAGNFERTFEGANGASAGKFFNANIKHLPCEKVEK